MSRASTPQSFLTIRANGVRRRAACGAATPSGDPVNQPPSDRAWRSWSRTTSTEASECQKCRKGHGRVHHMLEGNDSVSPPLPREPSAYCSAITEGEWPSHHRQKTSACKKTVSLYRYRRLSRIRLRGATCRLMPSQPRVLITMDPVCFTAWGNCRACGRIAFVLNRSQLRDSLERNQNVMLCCTKCENRRPATPHEVAHLRQTIARVLTSGVKSDCDSLPETYG
jgi:hypothetical protein